MRCQRKQQADLQCIVPALPVAKSAQCLARGVLCRIWHAPLWTSSPQHGTPCSTTAALSTLSAPPGTRSGRVKLPPHNVAVSLKPMPGVCRQLVHGMAVLLDQVLAQLLTGLQSAGLEAERVQRICQQVCLPL